MFLIFKVFHGICIITLRSRFAPWNLQIRILWLRRLNKCPKLLSDTVVSGPSHRSWTDLSLMIFSLVCSLSPDENPPEFWSLLSLLQALILPLTICIALKSLPINKQIYLITIVEGKIRTENLKIKSLQMLIKLILQMYKDTKEFPGGTAD